MSNLFRRSTFFMWKIPPKLLRALRAAGSVINDSERDASYNREETP